MRERPRVGDPHEAVNLGPFPKTTPAGLSSSSMYSTILTHGTASFYDQGLGLARGFAELGIPCQGTAAGETSIEHFACRAIAARIVSDTAEMPN